MKAPHPQATAPASTRADDPSPYCPRVSPPISAPASPPAVAACALLVSTPSNGAMNIVWIARRPGPVKRFQVSLPPPPMSPVLRPIVTDSIVTVGSL
jgi:hypothetical protein